MINFIYLLFVLLISNSVFSMVVIKHPKTSSTEWNFHLQNHPEQIPFSIYYQNMNSTLSDSQFILIDQLKAARLQKDSSSESQIRAEILKSLELKIWNESIRNLLLNAWPSTDQKQLQIFTKYDNLFLEQDKESTNNALNDELIIELKKTSGVLLINGWTISESDLPRIQFNKSLYYQIIILSDSYFPFIFNGFVKDLKFSEFQPIVSGDCYSPKWSPQLNIKSTLAIFPNHCSAPFTGTQFDSPSNLEGVQSNDLIKNPILSENSNIANDEKPHSKWLWYAGAIAAGLLINNLANQYQIEISL